MSLFLKVDHSTTYDTFIKKIGILFSFNWITKNNLQKIYNSVRLRYYKSIAPNILLIPRTEISEQVPEYDNGCNFLNIDINPKKIYVF